MGQILLGFYLSHCQWDASKNSTYRTPRICPKEGGGGSAPFASGQAHCGDASFANKAPAGVDIMT
jgi:hypothetical protein